MVYAEMMKGNFSFAILVSSLIQIVLMIVTIILTIISLGRRKKSNGKRCREKECDNR